MPLFHHVNLGVPVGGASAEDDFLVDFLGYKRVELTPDVPPTAMWFESEDGKQVHVSEDPDHRPAARAHVAIDVGNELPGLRDKFDQAGFTYEILDFDDRRVVLCRDPAGNLWELRGALPV